MKQVDSQRPKCPICGSKHFIADEKIVMCVRCGRTEETSVNEY